MSALLDNGNVQLRDLKSQGLYDVFHVTRLRPYLTHTTETPLKSDEYVVEKILDRRGAESNREYLIKWKGWSSKFNGWEPQAHLMRHCMEEVAAFDASRDADRPKPKGKAGRKISAPTVAPPKSQSLRDQETHDRALRRQARAQRTAAAARTCEPSQDDQTRQLEQDLHPDAKCLIEVARGRPATAPRFPLQGYGTTDVRPEGPDEPKRHGSTNGSLHPRRPRP